MERERELELRDQLAKLEAKIKSLQIIWGPASNNAQNTASIWAPTYGSLSVPSESLWPMDGPSRTHLMFSPSNNNRNFGYNTLNQQQSIESPSHIPYNINLNEDNANNQG